MTKGQLGLGLDLEDSAFRMALKRARDSGAIALDGDNVRLSAAPKQSAVTKPPSIEGGWLCDGTQEKQ